MDDSGFLQLTYDQYKTELALADSLLQRAAILLTAVVIVGGAAASIARIDLLGQSMLRWSVLCLHLNAALVGIVLVLAITKTFAAAWPRDYPRLNKMYFWIKWRHQYRTMLETDDPEDEDRNRQVLAEATHDALLSNLADAQATAGWLNQKRLAAIHAGVLCLAIATGGLVIESLLALNLQFTGVLN